MEAEREQAYRDALEAAQQAGKVGARGVDDFDEDDEDDEKDDGDDEGDEWDVRPSRPSSLATASLGMALVASAALHPGHAEAATAMITEDVGVSKEAVQAAIFALRPSLALLEFLFIMRIPMGWTPEIKDNAFPWVLAYIPTEPLMRFMRKVVPTVGGVDISAVVWFAILSFLNEILIGPQGLLVMLSRQG